MKKNMIPIAEIIQEANDLYLFCNNDKVELLREGLDWNDVEKLQSLMKRCIEAHSEYQLCKDKSVIETAKLNNLILKCRKLRSYIAEKIRSVAARTNNYINLPSYRKSWSRTVLIQDLNDLAVIGNTYKAMLLNSSFDLSKLDLAAKLSVELEERIVDSIVSKPSDSPQKAVRDKILSELLFLIARIRVFGKSAFWDNLAKRKIYACDYLRAKRLKEK